MTKPCITTNFITICIVNQIIIIQFYYMLPITAHDFKQNIARGNMPSSALTALLAAYL